MNHSSKPLDLALVLTFLALLAYVLCGANVLTSLSIPYEAEGGSFFFKLHPGSYLIYGATLTIGLSAVFLRANVEPLGKQATFASGYCTAIILCAAYAFLSTGRGTIIVLIDSFLPAGLFALLIMRKKSIASSGIRCLLQAGIFLNAVFALYEYSIHRNLVPIFLQGAQLHTNTTEFRPTALYDHPLTGGEITLAGLFLAPHALFLRYIYIGLLFAALLAFGGRVAVCCSIASAVFYSLSIFGKEFLVRPEKCLFHGLKFLLVLPCFWVILPVFLTSGLAERLAAHLYWDGSAQVRVSQWGILDELTLTQIIFGARRDDLISMIEPLRLSHGVEVIENFWLLMFVSLGVVGFTLFLVAFWLLFRWMWAVSDLRGRILAVAVIVTATTSNSLGRKSCLLSVLVGAIAAIGQSSAHPGKRRFVSIISPG